MKKSIALKRWCKWSFALLSCIAIGFTSFSLVSCSNGSDDDTLPFIPPVNNGGTETKDAVKLLSEAKDGSTVDFSNITLESGKKYIVSKSITLKNADLKTGTLIVDASNVTLSGIKNGSIVLSKNATSATISDTENISTLSISEENAGTLAARAVTAVSKIVLKNVNVQNVVSKRPGLEVVVKGKTKIVAIVADGSNISIKIASADVKIEKKSVAIKIEVATKDDLEAGEELTITAEVVTKIENEAASLTAEETNAIEKEAGEAESKPEAKPDETKPAEKAPAEEKKAEEQKEESKPAETKPTETSSEEKKEDTTIVNDVEIPVSDSSESVKELISEAYKALNAGDYDKALSKFRSAYAKEQTDETKIYYALTELATLSTDTDVVDIIENNFGIKNYPATPNAIFNSSWVNEVKNTNAAVDSVLNTEWLKKYPELCSASAAKVKQKAEENYMRCSATPVSMQYLLQHFDLNAVYNSNSATYDSYILCDDVWIDYRDYCKSKGIKDEWLTDIKPDENGKYLFLFNVGGLYGFPIDMSAYEAEAQAREEIKDYLYEVKTDWTGTEYHRQVTKSTEGDYIRLTGTETSAYSNEYMWCSYVNKGGNTNWESSGSYLKDYSLSNEGDYLCHKGDYISKLAVKYARKDLTACFYDAESYRANILGKVLYLPELAEPDWLSSHQAYQDSMSTVFGTTQTYKTWLYLFYANLITNNEKGGNEIVDKLLKVVHAKNESIKKVVDSMGEGTATLDPTFIKNLRLTDLIGEDSVIISKTEMQILSAALEACDAALNFVASYDLSADLKCGEDVIDVKDSVAQKNEIIKAVNDAISAKTLSVRDAAKLETSKAMFSNAFERIISCYDSIKNSTLYPQIVKDKIAEYGAGYYDGLVKAKAALDNGDVFYLPKAPNAKTFPTSEADALFGIDFGKLFTAGYLTDIIERNSDKESIKFYYRKYESTTGYEYKKSESGSLPWPYNEYSESEVTEFTVSIEDFLATTVAEDPGTLTYKNTDDGFLYKKKKIWYQIGILVNKELLTQALPGIENAQDEFGTMNMSTEKLDRLRFIKIFKFEAPTKTVDE